MTLKQAEERLAKIESVVESILTRLEVMEKKLEAVEVLRKDLGDTENRQAFYEISVDDKMKEVNSEVDSKIVAGELRCEEKIKVLGDKFIEIVDKAIAIESKVDKLSGDWPTPAEAAEAYTLVRNKRNEVKRARNQNPSHAEKFKN